MFMLSSKIFRVFKIIRVLTVCVCARVCAQIVEAMEIMLLAVVSPEIRCEWHLEDWQVALVSTVSHSTQTDLLIIY